MSSLKVSTSECFHCSATSASFFTSNELTNMFVNLTRFTASGVAHGVEGLRIRSNVFVEPWKVLN